MHRLNKSLANKWQDKSTETSLFQKRTVVGEKDKTITDSRTGRKKYSRRCANAV